VNSINTTCCLIHVWVSCWVVQGDLGMIELLLRYGADQQLESPALGLLPWEVWHARTRTHLHYIRTYTHTYTRFAQSCVHHCLFVLVCAMYARDTLSCELLQIAQVNGFYGRVVNRLRPRWCWCFCMKRARHKPLTDENQTDASVE